MAEAHAKMHLREMANDDDINMAIRVTLNTFISSQKHSVAQQLTRTFSKYVTSKKDSNRLCYYTLQGFVQDALSASASGKQFLEILAQAIYPIISWGCTYKSYYLT
jgi:DNA replicative helicase MCM subunit Mcm2 (Cdc46/Mcm family)